MTGQVEALVTAGMTSLYTDSASALAAMIEVRMLHVRLLCYSCADTGRADYFTDSDFCDNNMREKDWRYRKRGTQAK